VNWGTAAIGGDLGNPVFTGTASATPLPAALPLFATGLGALGLVGWRRKRKLQTANSGMQSKLLAAFCGAVALWFGVPSAANAVTVDTAHSVEVNFGNITGGPYDNVDIQISFSGDLLDIGDSLNWGVYDANNVLLKNGLVNKISGPPAPSIFMVGGLSALLTTSSLYVLVSANSGSVDITASPALTNLLAMDCISCSPITHFSGTATISLTQLETTPLPAALPLFATGLGAFGLLGWRRKRKAKIA
jgi:hypothetical protein